MMERALKITVMALTLGAGVCGELVEASQPEPRQRAVQPEIPDLVAGLRSLPNGLTTVGSLNLPESFLQHVADWEVRGSIRKATRRLHPDPPRALPVAATDDVPLHADVVVRTVALPQELIDQWTTFTFSVPNLAGFRAPVAEQATDPWPFDLRDRGENTEAYREAAVFVANSLPREGVIRTTMRVMSRSSLNFLRDNELNLARLRAIGIPVDWLAFFTVDGAPVANHIHRWAQSGMDADAVDELARRARFQFAPSRAGFRAMAEDGSEPIGMLRLQLPTHRFRLGEGDGSVVDIFRQLAQQLPDMPMCVSMHQQAAPTLQRALTSWSVSNASRITFVPHDANITQWAQDNGKAGYVAGGANGSATVVTLVPRFASRTELRTTFVPSDSFVMESLAKAGLSIVQSPLLFQGGNLLCVVDPRTGLRLLLVGEAEIHRNVALGLTADQVQQALAMEFGVSRVVVLPAVSFHIDLDVTIRNCNGELVACVNDDLAASRIIYIEGLRALAAGKVISNDLVAQYQQSRTDQDRINVINTASMALKPLRTPDGYSAQFTAIFQRGGLESPAANAQRFLVAADTLFAEFISERELNQGDMPKSLRMYLEALRRQQKARDSLAAQLKSLGMNVHRVAGLNDHEVSINYVNGIHLTDTYLMPSFGGWFEPLDRAAREQLQDAFGPAVRIVPIMAGMAQENDGGLHCMVGLYPAAPSP